MENKSSKIAAIIGIVIGCVLGSIMSYSMLKDAKNVNYLLKKIKC